MLSYAVVCFATSRQGDSLEELKAMLQRESAGVDLSGIEPLPVPAPAPVPTPEQPYGYDGSQEGERDFSNGDGERGAIDSSRGGARSILPTAAASRPVPVSVPAVSKKRSAAEEKRGRRRRSTVRRMSSSTSYKASSVYDRDYTFEEHDIDLFENKKDKDPETPLRKGQGQEIVTIPCDLTDAGSAVEVMRELKRMGIDDKVTPPSPALPSLALSALLYTLFILIASVLSVECYVSRSILQSL